MTEPALPGDDSFFYPHWRLAWEEQLDQATRRRIAKAVRAGSALSDPVEARYAVTVAYRERRIWRWWPLISLVMVGYSVVLLVLLSTNPITSWTSLDRLLALAALLVILLDAPLTYRRYRRLVLAEELNRKVVG